VRSSIAGLPSKGVSLSKFVWVTACTIPFGAGSSCNVYTPELLTSSAAGGSSSGGKLTSSGGRPSGGAELGGDTAVAFAGGASGATGGTSFAGTPSFGGVGAYSGATPIEIAGSTNGGSLGAGGTGATAGLAPGAGTDAGGTVSTGGARSSGGVPTGGKASTAGTTSTGGSPPTGGKTGAAGKLIDTCAKSVPASSCNLTVDFKGYVTTGAVKGMAYPWKSDTANATTYVNSPCTASGCTTPAGTSAICTSGSVTADPSFHSAAGLWLNLNEDSKGNIGSITIPNSITVNTYKSFPGTGNVYIRIQLTDSAGIDYCVLDNRWSDGNPIPIVSFNTACWDGSGSSPSASTQIVEMDLIVPSTNIGDRPFDFCLLSVTVQ